MYSGLWIRILIPLLLSLPTLASNPKEAEKYELTGKLVDPAGKPFRGVVPTAYIRSASGVFSRAVLVGPGGGFKIKGLEVGTYNLVLSVPRYGETRKTVEIGPSFADPKGRIGLVVEFADENRIPLRSTVSAAQLSVSYKAVRRYEKAHRRLGNSDVKGAVKELREAIKISPEFAAAWNLLGTVEHQTMNYAEAEENFREALKHDPAYYPPLVNLGGAVLAQGKVDEAVRLNSDAVKARPDDPLAQSQLGQAYLFREDLEKAEFHLKQAKILDSSHFSFPQLFLAEVYRLRGEKRSQLNELEEFVGDHPDSPLAPAIREVIGQLKAGH